MLATPTITMTTIMAATAAKKSLFDTPFDTTLLLVGAGVAAALSTANDAVSYDP